MRFWQADAVVELLFVCALLALAALARRVVPGLGKLSIPDAMVAGLVGLLLGPSALDLLPIDTDHLEVVVYHGLALVFIALCLRSPMKTKAKGRESALRGLTFAIPVNAVAQGFIGLLLVYIWSLSAGPVHPGYGFMLPLAFSQGPGQALSIGTAWEASGMEHGGQVGLAMAAVGFVWSVVVGVPLVHLGRKMGWTTDPSTYAPKGPEADERLTAASLAGPGALDPLTRHVAFIGVIYLLTFGTLSAITSRLGNPETAAMVWGFHFLVAMVFALGARRLIVALQPEGRPPNLHDATLSRIGGLVVDITTCGAIAAVRPDVLGLAIAPILVISTIGGLATFFWVLWYCRRSFVEVPFEYALVIFGSATGTLPTGLALLRVQDPDLRTPASGTYVLGSAAALPLAIPLLLFVLPMPIAGFPESFPDALLLTLGVLVVYLGALFAGWTFLGPLKWTRPLWHPWPARQTPAAKE